MNSRCLTVGSKAKDKLEHLGRKLRKAKEIAVLLEDKPSTQKLIRSIEDASRTCDMLWLFNDGGER